MSEPESNPNASTADRVADVLTGLATAAQAVGLEQHRAMLADARQRTLDSHAAMMRQLGYEVPPADRRAPAGGNIVVTGDIYGGLPPGLLAGGTARQPATKPSPSSSMAKPNRLRWLVLLAMAVAGASGAGATWLVPKLMTRAENAVETPPIVAPQGDVGLRVIPWKPEADDEPVPLPSHR